MWAVTKSANTDEEPSRALPFWVEDRIGEGEKRLWGHGWLRGDFMRRTGAGDVDLVRLTGKDLLSAVGCRQGFFWGVFLKSKALMRTCFQCRLWQFLTHTMNGGWMWHSVLERGRLLLLFSCSIMSDSLWPPSSLSFTISQSLFKLMSIELVMLSNHLIFCFSSFPPTLSLSQHQGLFQWVCSSHHLAKVLELQLQHQSF